MTRVTLTQAAQVLQVPQHKLIHLCEKGVVVPEIHDARGRGSSRGFSRRNLFEFAVALEMRRLDLPVKLARAVLRVLEVFEEAVARSLPGFSLPDSLLSTGAPHLSALILDGERLYFTMARGRSAPILFGGVDVPRTPSRDRGKHLVPLRRVPSAAARRLIQDARTRTEIDLSQIAKVLPPEEP
jgi:hypothetical protein